MVQIHCFKENDKWCGGWKYNLYIFRFRKWKKIGEYCTECGIVKILKPDEVDWGEA